MTLKWNAWNQDNGDIGDGPIVAYNVYETNSPFPLKRVIASPDLAPLILATIENLMAGTVYYFYVTVEREGPGGEGPVGRMVEVTTSTADLPIQPKLTTTSVGGRTEGRHTTEQTQLY